MSGLAQVVTSGSVLLAMPVAAAAGAVTFLSPCVLPLVPGYLSYVTGMSGEAAQSAGRRRPPRPAGAPAASVVPAPGPAPAPAAAAGGGVAVAMRDRTAGEPGAGGGARPLLGALLFILGFSALFTLYGAVFGGVAEFLRRDEVALTRILGVLVIVMGLLFLGALDRFSFAGRIIKPSVRPRAGLVGAPLLGVMFGLGWLPCSSPTLVAVLSLGYSSGTAARSALLAFVYALGIGIPFLIVALAVNRGVQIFGFARQHARLITRIGGVLLIAVGLLEVTGTWNGAILWLKLHWPAF